MRLATRELFTETDLLEQAVALARKRAPQLSGDRDSVRRRLAAYLERWMVETDDPLLRGPVPKQLNAWPSIERTRGDR